VRRFLTDGSLVQQFGSGALRAVAAVPASRVWASGIGVGHIKVFDLSTGAQTGTLSLVGFTSVHSMSYSESSNTVFVVAGASVHELDLQGNELRVFDAPQGVGTVRATRGPNGDVFATTGAAGLVLHWSSGGDYLGSSTMPVDFGVNGIVWTGNAPEPAGALIALFAMPWLIKRHHRKAG
jgi:hypothetical protein